MGTYAFLIIAAAVISSAAAMLVSYRYGQVSRELSDARGELAELRGRTAPGIEVRTWIEGVDTGPIFEGNSVMINYMLMMDGDLCGPSCINRPPHKHWHTLIRDNNAPLRWEFRPVDLPILPPDGN